MPLAIGEISLRFQINLMLHNRAVRFALLGILLQTAGLLAADYTGSAACQSCHAALYQRWSKTRMANVVRDPKLHPEAIIPDLTKPNPLVTFKSDDIAFVYGSKWKQRYFTKKGDDYFVLGAQWDITNRVWRPYKVSPNADNSTQATGPLCDGCHSVNYNVQTKSVTEWNVGCEKCHGPGSAHVAKPSQTNITNPARLSAFGATDVCIQCHSEGKPLSNPIAGKVYDWPVGFEIGRNLSDFWKLDPHKPGEQTVTHFADGTAHKNRMQGNDFTQSAMYTHGIACNSCHDAHGTENNADLLKPANVMCLECHGPNSPNGPHSPTLEAHSHHAAGTPGNECISCHMPKIAAQIADVNVRSHTFRFVPPSQTAALKIPNACNVCHADKTTEWSADALKTWRNFSPWRVAVTNVAR